jgi:16S rRNA (guanine966-N2)-methyltransferase
MGVMRVISGRYRGARLIGPKESWMRPTSDRVKEFMFSYLSFRIEHYTSVLDLFAGTGSLGIEAASRGANHVVFVEKSKRAIEILERNLEKVNLKADIIRFDVVKSLDKFESMKSRFDIVFCDPPYDYLYTNILINKIDDSNIIAPGGWLVYEHGTRQNMTSVNRLVVVKARRFGDTIVTFMKNERV